MSIYSRFRSRIEHTRGECIERVVLLMENSLKVTLFSPTYSSDFEQKAFVEKVIADWNSRSESFNLQSSGSTGLPKTIALSRELLVWSAESTRIALQLDRHILYSVFCCLPVTKTGGFMQLIRALHFGWRIHFENPTSHPTEQMTMDTHVDLISLTPQQAQNSLAIHAELLATAKAILIGGAPITSQLLKVITQFTQKTKVNVWQTYGMTETASHIAIQKIGQDTYFKPQPGVDISLDNDQLCIAISELNFYSKTSDIATLHPDGFELLGRADDVINSGGVKIHPAIIEPLISEQLLEAGIKRPFYLSKKTDKTLGEKAVLVMEGTPIKEGSFVLEMLKRALPPYHHPKEIVFVDHIAYTDTGKVKREPVEKLSSYSDLETSTQ
jgi:O-succinylbenzoic acid--CoA ligase